MHDSPEHMKDLFRQEMQTRMFLALHKVRGRERCDAIRIMFYTQCFYRSALRTFVPMRSCSPRPRPQMPMPAPECARRTAGIPPCRTISCTY